MDYIVGEYHKEVEEIREFEEGYFFTSTHFEYFLQITDKEVWEEGYWKGRGRGCVVNIYSIDLLTCNDYDHVIPNRTKVKTQTLFAFDKEYTVNIGPKYYFLTFNERDYQFSQPELSYIDDMAEVLKEAVSLGLEVCDIETY